LLLGLFFLLHFRCLCLQGRQLSLGLFFLDGGNLSGSVRHHLFSLALLLLSLADQLLLLVALGVELTESRRKRIAQLLLFGNLLRLVFLNGRVVRQVLREL